MQLKNNLFIIYLAELQSAIDGNKREGRRHIEDFQIRIQNYQQFKRMNV